MIEIVAKTIYGEARDCGILDKLAVGAVIRERVLRPGYWGDSWESVCLKEGQFECWNKDNRKLLDEAYTNDHRRFLSCLTVAEYIINHFTDEDAAEIFENGNVFPTHYHRKGTKYPMEWGEAGVDFKVGWKSKFKFYARVKGSPERK